MFPPKSFEAFARSCFVVFVVKTFEMMGEILISRNV